MDESALPDWYFTPSHGPRCSRHSRPDPVKRPAKTNSHSYFAPNRTNERSEMSNIGNRDPSRSFTPRRPGALVNHARHLSAGSQAPGLLHTIRSTEHQPASANLPRM